MKLLSANELLFKLNSGGSRQKLIAKRPEGIQEALNLLDKAPGKSKINEAIRFASVLVRAQIPEHFLRQVLRFYPPAHIYLVNGDFGDISLREAMADALAYTLLGCAWPRENDAIDRGAFLGLIEQQAVDFGFTPIDGKALKRKLVKLGVERLAECLRTGASAQIQGFPVKTAHGGGQFVPPTRGVKLVK